MPIEHWGTLLVLALADSTSFGTLLIPVWLLMAPGRMRAPRIAAYLLTVTIAYFAIGVLLMTAGRLLLDAGSELLSSPALQVGQLVLGLVLLGFSIALDTKQARARAARRDARSGRLARWRERAVGEGRGTSIVVLALTAVVVEAASMLPYVAATGIIAAQTSTWPAALVVLACYCAVMIAPATILSIARLAAHAHLEAPLGRLDRWLTRNARSATLWIVGIVGFLLAATAIQALGWL